MSRSDNLRFIVSNHQPTVVSDNFWTICLDILGETGSLSSRHEVIDNLQDQQIGNYFNLTFSLLGKQQELLSLDVLGELSVSNCLAHSVKIRVRPISKHFFQNICFRVKVTGTYFGSGYSSIILPALTTRISFTPENLFDYGKLQRTLETCRYLDLPSHHDALFLEKVNNIIAVECPDLYGFFGVVWDSSFYLAHYLLSGQIDICGKTVFDMGAGTGYVGMLCTQLGASKVVLSDTKLMTNLLHRNALENDLENSVTILEYNWGQNISKHVSTSLETLPLNYDIILGSDIIFDPSYWHDIYLSFNILSHKDTIVILSTKVRNILENGFFDVIESHNWDINNVIFDNVNRRFDECKIYAMRKKIS